jgi:DUF2075 family protein
MIIYSNKLQLMKNGIDVGFLAVSQTPQIQKDIEDGFLRNGITWGGPNEARSWLPSLRQLGSVLSSASLPGDVDVGIEYRLPMGGDRIDFLILGADKNDNENIVVVELKQWSIAKVYDPQDDVMVLSDLNGGKKPSRHPCYQAFSYKTDLMNYCSVIAKDNISVHPLAYCMNLMPDGEAVLRNKPFEHWPQEAPLFVSGEETQLRNEITKYIFKKSKSNDPLYRIDKGMLVPSKSLQKALKGILQGNETFALKGNQEEIGRVCDSLIRQSIKDKQKRTIIVKGGPGTGKSVLAINEVVAWHQKGYFSIYYTKNSTPRHCYEQLVAKHDSTMEAMFEGMFPSQNGIADFARMPMNSVTVGLFDEAHRLQKFPYQYRSKNMLHDIIYESLVSIFFIDECQQITTKDIGNEQLIVDEAKAQGSLVYNDPDFFTLTSQFRCSGSDAYPAFLDNFLGIRETEQKLPPKDYDLQIFDDPFAMKAALQEKNTDKTTARMVAGYCYDWNQKHPERGIPYDFKISTPTRDFLAVWNSPSKSTTWAVRPESFDEIGCVHTCQGMEFDYVGVFIGRDLTYREGRIITNQKAISKDDSTSGIRSTNPDNARRLIQNTYRVLLTRGLKGCYVYCEDEGLRNYLRSLIAKAKEQH